MYMEVARTSQVSSQQGLENILPLSSVPSSLLLKPLRGALPSFPWGEQLHTFCKRNPGNGLPSVPSPAARSLALVHFCFVLSRQNCLGLKSAPPQSRTFIITLPLSSPPPGSGTWYPPVAGPLPPALLPTLRGSWTPPFSQPRLDNIWSPSSVD